MNKFSRCYYRMCSVYYFCRVWLCIFEKVEKWWDIIWLQWLEHTTNRQNIKTHFRCNIFPISVKWKGPVESLISEFYQTSPLDRL